MKETNGLGPMSAGAGVPSTPKRDVGDTPFGTALDPGFDYKDTHQCSRNAAKFKSYTREPIPKTPS